MRKEDQNNNFEVASKKQFLSLYKALQDKYPKRDRILGITLNVLFLAICNSTQGRSVSSNIRTQADVHPEIENEIQITIKRPLIVQDDLPMDTNINQINQNVFYIPITCKSKEDKYDESGLFQIVNAYLNDNFVDVRISAEDLNKCGDVSKADAMDKNMLEIMCNVYESLCTTYNFRFNSLKTLRILDVFYYGYNKSSLFVDEKFINLTKNTHIIIARLLSVSSPINARLPYVSDLNGRVYEFEICHESIYDEEEICDFIIRIYNDLYENNKNDEMNQFKNFFNTQDTERLINS